MSAYVPKVLPILTDDDPRLRLKCTPVALFDDALRNLAWDLGKTMREANGLGLAAPQVGLPYRLFVMVKGDKVKCFVNPRVVPAAPSKAFVQEGCLSFPGKTARRGRYGRIRLHYQDLSGIQQSIALAGMEAVCAQHECDHLDGVVLFP